MMAAATGMITVHIPPVCRALALLRGHVLLALGVRGGILGLLQTGAPCPQQQSLGTTPEQGHAAISACHYLGCGTKVWARMRTGGQEEKVAGRQGTGRREEVCGVH